MKTPDDAGAFNLRTMENQISTWRLPTTEFIAYSDADGIVLQAARPRNILWKVGIDAQIERVGTCPRS
jgi:hypothetical protein